MFINEEQHSFPFTEDCNDIKVSLNDGVFIVIRMNNYPVVHSGFFDRDSFPRGKEVKIGKFRINEFLERIHKIKDTFDCENVESIEIVMVSKKITKDKIDHIKQRIQETFGKTIAMNNFEYEDIIPGEEVTGEYSVNHGIMKVSGYKMIGCMEEISYMYSGGIWNDLRYRP